MNNTEENVVIPRWPLYTKMGWGLVVLFGLVGLCSGHREGALAVFIITVIVWTCVRILAEALLAWQVLVIDNLRRKKPTPSKKDDKDDPTLPPPNATA